MDEQHPLTFLSGKDDIAMPAPQAEPAEAGGADTAPVAAEPASTPAPASTEASPPPPPPEPDRVPITALLDEREKRRGLEARLAEFERRHIEALQAARAAELEPHERLAEQMRGQTLAFSRRLAERAYGKETLEQLHQWAVQRCDADPHYNQRMLAAEDPYEAAYQDWRREQLLAEVSPDDLEDYRAWKKSRLETPAAASPPAPPAAPAASPAPPPRSLATATNAGGPGASTDVPIGPGEAYRAVIR